jgi:HEAT repeat protein
MQQRIIIDLVSFLLGFAAATVFWWLVRRLKIAIPRLKETLKHQAEERRQRKLEGIGRYVRQESLQRARKMHLARELFPLDDILIYPRLLAPPNYLLDPSRHETGKRIAAQVIPYLPDWPEMSAPFPVDTLTAAQAMSKGAHLAIIGVDGSGRTVALAHLAAMVATRDASAEELANHVPILLHALDIDFQCGEGAEPIEVIQRSIAKMVPVFEAARVPKFSRELFSSGKALLLIDGVDELTPAALQEASAFLKSFLTLYPNTRLAMTASLDYLDGLSDLGIFPLAVTAWDASDRQNFVEKWSSLWSSHIGGEIEKRSGTKAPDPLLLKTWLTAEPALQTPLEWTLKVWAAYAGDVQGPSNMDSLHSYAIRLNHKSIPLDALSELAYSIFCSGLTALPYALVEKIFIKYKPDQSFVEESPEDEQSVDGTASENQTKSGLNKQARITSGENALNALVNSGLLIESPTGLVRFAHVQIAGYLASRSYPGGQELPPLPKILSALQINTLRYMAVGGKLNSWVKTALEQYDAPLYRHLLMISRWLPDAPAKLPWRSPVMRMLIQMVQNENSPSHLRQRCLAAIIASNDEAVSVLLKQLLDSESDRLCQLAAIGCGASQQTKTSSDLIKYLNSLNPNVASAACLSLGSFGTRLAFESMVDLLHNGDEGLQFAAAETLAFLPEGPDALQKATSSDQLLVRRAAVAGLALVRTEWSARLLEKLAIEDAQWVIQNAATEALSALNAPVAFVPQPLPEPDQAGWLIKYAGQHGKGIVPGEPATEYILAAVQNGSQEERLCALQYLRSIPEQASLSALYTTLEDPCDLIQEAAYYALWQLQSSGVELPNQYGF